MKYLALLLTAFLGSATPSFILQNQSVSTQNPPFWGKIVDEETGKPIAAAAVSVFQKGEIRAAAVADAAGFFKMDSLAAGVYDVEFGFAGFEKKRVVDVKIEAGQSLVLNISLKNGAVLEEVEVIPFGIAVASSASISEKKTTDSEGMRDGAGPGSAAPAYSFMHDLNPEARFDKAAEPAKPMLFESPATEKKETPASEEIRIVGGERSAYFVDGIRVKKNKVPAVSPSGEYKISPPPTLRLDEKMEREAPTSRTDDFKFSDMPGEPEPAPQPLPAAGLLTAGEWNDLQNWGKHWTDLLADGEIEPFQKQWQFFPKNRFSFLLTNENDFPLIDATLKLFDENGSPVWETRTDNTGHAEAWAGLFDGKTGQKLTAQVIFGGGTHDLGTPKPFAEGLNRHRFQFECAAPKNVDIVFAVDATGSMGDEIGYLQTELIDVLNRVKATNPSVNLRTGSVFYRDKTDEYIVRSSGLTTDLKKTVEYIQKQEADGGGDWPEAVHSALDEVVFHQNWSAEAVARICFFVLDASPHNSDEVKKSLQNATRSAAAKGIRLVPVVASGIQKETEWLMKFMDLATNGSYVFLTDHSGIGGHHLEPTVEEYKVEALNNLLVRLITEFSTVENCEGKTEIRFQNSQNGQQNGQNQTENVLFWPNPASSQITFELPFDADVVQLFDAEGKSVKKIDRLKKGQFELSVAGLPEGFYLLRILRGNEWQSGKLLVVRS